MAYLVTGAQGCIGAWIVKNLVETSAPVVVFDTDRQPRRLAQIISDEALQQIQFVEGDVAELSSLVTSIERYRVSRIIHLAGLQVPACQANPPRGGLVNVIGTLNVFEAAVKTGSVRKIVYASSIAVAGPPEDYTAEGCFRESSQLHPTSHYGVFKQCNEGNARVYFETRGIDSVGLRPWAVYGVGRDFGLTSDPTKAIKAAVIGRPFAIQFGGRADMQYVDDVAKIFLRCAEADVPGARIYNLRGEVLAVEDIIRTIDAVVPGARKLLSFRGTQLPIVPECDDGALRNEVGGIPNTPFAKGVEETVRIFRRLQSEGRLTAAELA